MTEKFIRTETANTNKSVYHTDKHCVRVSEVRPVSDAEVEYHELRLCAYCNPDASPTNTDQSRQSLNKLKEAANE